MTISKNNIHRINAKKAIDKQEHQDTTMALLKQLLDRKGWNQRQLAKELHRDTTTINRWTKNSREINWDNAEAIAKVIGCHPIEIYNPKSKFIVKQYCTADLHIKNYGKNEVQEFPIFYEALNENTFGIHFINPGIFLHGRIYLFDKVRFKQQKFDRNALGQICYFEPSDAIKKKFNNQCNPVMGILEKDGLTKYSIINPLTQKPVNEHAASITLDDISVCCPVKCEYYPELLSDINK